MHDNVPQHTPYKTEANGMFSCRHSAVPGPPVLTGICDYTACDGPSARVLSPKTPTVYRETDVFFDN